MNIEDLQTYCKSLEGVTESIKWDNELCFCIAEKMFAITNLARRDTVSFKVRPDQFDELIDRNQFISAPYLGRYKWVYMEDFKTITDQELNALVAQSYELVKVKLPKSVLKQLDN